MNNVTLVGRLTSDPELNTSPSGTSYVRFNIAVDRQGKDKGADFPTCIAFGKTAEILSQYGFKGKQIGVTGRLQTGSYNKDGVKVYTTDVMVDRLELLGSRSDESREEPRTELNNRNFATYVDDDEDIF